MNSSVKLYYIFLCYALILIYILAYAKAYPYNDLDPNNVWKKSFSAQSRHRRDMRFDPGPSVSDMGGVVGDIIGPIGFGVGEFLGRPIGTAIGGAIGGFVGGVGNTMDIEFLRHIPGNDFRK